MAAFANINIQKPSSLQPGSPGNFYSLCAEIRNLVYAYNAANAHGDNTFWPKFSQRGHCIAQFVPYGKSTSTAYFECSHMHYSNRHFVIANGNLLRKFLQEVSPMQVKAIKHLKIVNIARMTVAPKPGMQAVGPTSAYTSVLALKDLMWEKEYPRRNRLREQNFSFVKEFQGLKTLTIGRKWHTGRRVHPEDQEEMFGAYFSMLATLCGSMPDLEEIVLTTEISSQDFSSYQGLAVGYIPGWSYSIGESTRLDEGLSERITETLRRLSD